MNFLNTPASWLEGITPGAYFTQFEDAKVLADWFNEYCTKGIPARPVAGSDSAGGQTLRKAAGGPAEGRGGRRGSKNDCCGPLREMESTAPKMLYIQWQLDRAPKDELRDNALESLAAMGKEALPQMLQELPHANEAGKEALLDVLSNFPGNEQVFQLAMRLFRENPERRALFADTWGSWGMNAPWSR